MKTEDEIYEILWRELGRFVPHDPEEQAEFDWRLSKIAKEVAKISKESSTE